MQSKINRTEFRKSIKNARKIQATEWLVCILFSEASLSKPETLIECIEYKHNFSISFDESDYYDFDFINLNNSEIMKMLSDMVLRNDKID